MEEKDGLILGIDLQEEMSQVCFYNEQLNTPMAAAGDNGAAEIPNPVRLSEYFIQDEQGMRIGELAEMLNIIIECGRRSAGRMKLAGICICVENFITEQLEGIASAMEKLQIEREDYEIISRSEAFAYYAYSQKKELYSVGTMLLDLNEYGLKTHRLTSARKNGVDFIHEKRKDFTTDSLKAVGRGEAGMDSACDELCQIITELTRDIHYSSVYLTGKGFECDKLPDKLTKAICSRRKAFAGQNLYVKGACFCAKEKLKPLVFDNLILDCGQRIRYGLETDINERGQLRRLRMVRPGTNWFEAEKFFDFILEDERQITFYLTDLSGVVGTECIDISGIPFRQGKTTRIGVHVKYMAADRCMITVKDKGFGQFIKSSGKIFDLEISLNQERHKE